MDIRVEFPMKGVVLLEFVGLVFDTGMMIDEDELEDGDRASLDKIDRNFYVTISNLLRNNDRPYIPFK